MKTTYAKYFRIILISMIGFSLLSCSSKQDNKQRGIIELIENGYCLPGSRVEDYQIGIKNEIEKVTKQIKNNRNDINLYIQRGFQFKAIGEIEKAKIDFSFVLKKDSSNTFALTGLALCSYGSETSRYFINKLLLIDEYDAVAYYLRALTHHNSPSLFLKDLEYSIELNPDFIIPYLSAGMYLSGTDSLLSALKFIDVAISKKIKPALLFIAFLTRKNINEKLGNFNDVLSDLDSMVVLDKKNSAVYLELKIDYLKKLGDSLAIREIEDTLKKMAKNREE